MKPLKLLVVALAAVAMSTQAAGQVSWSKYRAVYDSDASMTEEVGYVIITCDDRAYGNGYLTPFYTEEHWDC
jgi:hypothetical protein